MITTDAPNEREHGLSIVGYDSAWTDKKTAPGAVCAIRRDIDGAIAFTPPTLAGFDDALQFIREEQKRSKLCLVALDQPTKVPNLRGSRPVDKVAGSLISWVGGGVQPANRSKLGMFDYRAPIWRFLDRLEAREDPESSRLAESGLFLIEVFPALALLALQPHFCGRLSGPRYNPGRRSTFQISHWRAVIETVRGYATQAAISGLPEWCDHQISIGAPKKADQDKLDAVICAIIGLHWRTRPRDESLLLGDLETGYMVTPTCPEVALRLEAAAVRQRVPINGEVLQEGDEGQEQSSSWRLQAFDSLALLWEERLPPRTTETRVRLLMQCLAARDLSRPDLIDATIGRSGRSALLEVRQSGSSLSIGENPHYVADRVKD